MNEITVNVNFEKGICDVTSINLKTSDYNSTKLVFTFDKDSGTKVFKMKNPNDETIFENEIIDNEVILVGKDGNDNNASLFNSAGDYPFEVVLYGEDSRITSASNVLSVEETVVKEDDREIEVYKPLIDTMMEELTTAINETENIDITATKEENTAIVTVTKKDGTTESVEILDGEKGDKGETGEAGQDGADAKINGVNTLNMVAGSNITLEQEGSTLTINSTGGGSGTSNYNDLTNKPTINNVELIGNKTSSDLGLQPAGNYALESEIPDVSNFITKSVDDLTYYTLSTNTGSTIELTINSSTYVVTLNLKNSAGTTISTGSIDLPLETMVVGGSYNDETKKIILTLKNGQTVEFSVADLVSGLQSEITSNNKLSSDLVDDTNNTNKFVTASEKTTWNNKLDTSAVKTTTSTTQGDVYDVTYINTMLGDIESLLGGI